MTTIESVATIYAGWGKYLDLTLRAPDGRTRHHQVDDHGDAVCVLPYDPVRRVALLVRQVRPTLLYKEGTEHTLEAPAGLLDGGDPADEARREAMEEAGLGLGALEDIGVFWSTPGVSTERLHLYLAAYSLADRTGDGGGLAEEHEDITVVEMGFAELARLADGGGPMDMKTFAAIQTLRLRRPELFG